MQGGGRNMVKFSKSTVVSGLAALMIAIIGTVLLMSQPAQSKNDKTATGDGISTTLGF